MTPRDLTRLLVAQAKPLRDAEVLAVIKAMQDACGALLVELNRREHLRAIDRDLADRCDRIPP